MELAIKFPLMLVDAAIATAPVASQNTFSDEAPLIKTTLAPAPVVNAPPNLK
jgi:hypothetical protein